MTFIFGEEAYHRELQNTLQGEAGCGELFRYTHQATKQESVFRTELFIIIVVVINTTTHREELLSQQLVQNRYVTGLKSKKTRDVSSSFCRLAILKRIYSMYFC